MSTPAMAGAPPPPPLDQQGSYTFSGRVLLTAVVFLVAIAVVYLIIRVLLYHCVARRRGGRGSLAAGILRSFNSFGRSGRHGGLDAAALAALPVTAYRKDEGSVASGAAGADDCAVCLSEFADGEKVRRLPSCGHVFHVECVDAWLRSRTTCPVCRADAGPKPARPSSSSSAAAPPPPALFGAGGTLVVTVQDGVSDAGRDARGSTTWSGHPIPGAS